MLHGMMLTLALLLALQPEPPARAYAGPPLAVLAQAQVAFRAHRQALGKRDVLAIVDYDRSWQDERLWILDARTHAVRFFGHVRHAAASNDARSGRAVACSNVAGSFKSSNGAFVTERTTYEGHYGHSLRVRGLEPGVNDKALAREIVIHPAGRLTFSAGCFMIPDEEAQQVVDLLAGGTLLYAHGCRSAPDAP